jgi:uncharacterized protein YggU (UPF0235/DUF167 family)
MRDGVRVAIRLTPRAKADRVVSVAAAAGGGQVVKAKVTAPPEDGRAHEALLQLLARGWRVPRRDLAIRPAPPAGKRRCAYRATRSRCSIGSAP